MATLILSTVGTAVGGPVGGAIGALIGQSIDQQLLGPSTRGPRVGDLKVQSSTYGTQIPRIYGSMRVAGQVIWATDLVESSEASAVKGGPSTTYSYSVSLAVALSSRAVRSVGRIWADGKLLRGAAGDFKVSTKFRFYSGGDDQDLDPLIASAEGLSNTPAYRGLALAVFEDLDLSEFANRIPFLTFELCADEMPTKVGEILNDASGGVIECSDPAELTGYAAYGRSIKAAIAPLVDAYAIQLFDDGSRLTTAGDTVTSVTDDELGNSADGREAARIQRAQVPSSSLPSTLRLSYYDPALDYQSGEARASSAEVRGVDEQQELPAAVAADSAKSLAQTMLAREWARRDRLTLRLPPRYLALEPGSRVDLDLTPTSWSVEQLTIESYVVVAELRPSWTASPSVASDPGRITANQDVIAADISLAFFDIPDVLQQGFASPTLMLAASSSSPGWRARSVEVLAGEQSLQIATARRKAVLGHASTLLGSGDPYLIDQSGFVDVELVDQEQWLVSCDDDALIGGSNLAVLGSEVLQFGSVEPLGAGRFRLSSLLRGRAGTEWAMETHATGEPFALIDGESLCAVTLPSWSIGANVAASSTNLSGVVSSAAVVMTGESVRPVSPVDLRAAFDSGGNLQLSWTRRSRKGFAWIDGVDAPLGETTEQYRVSISGAAETAEFLSPQPSLNLSAAELAEVGSGEVTIEVRQIGDAGASRPAELVLTF